MTQGNSGAQNKLGELFVDFGTKGVGGLLRNLNSVSASFLLGKNAANQFIQTISKPFKDAGDFAIQLRKIRNELGLTANEAQKIQNWAKKYSISEGSVLGDFASVMDNLSQIKMYNKIPQGWYEAARLLVQQGGVDITKNRYNNTPEDTIRFIQDVGTGLEKISDIGTRRLIQEKLGVSQEVLTYYKYLNEMLEDTNTLTDKQTKNLEELNKSFQKLGTATGKLGQKATSFFSPAVTKGTNFTADLISPGRQGDEARFKFSTFLLKSLLVGPEYDLSSRNMLNLYKPKNKKNSAPFELLPELDSLGDSDLLHSNGGGNTTVYKEINVNQNITAPDPITAGNKAAQGINELETAELNMYSGR